MRIRERKRAKHKIRTQLFVTIRIEHWEILILTTIERQQNSIKELLNGRMPVTGKSRFANPLSWKNAGTILRGGMSA